VVITDAIRGRSGATIIAANRVIGMKRYQSEAPVCPKLRSAGESIEVSAGFEVNRGRHRRSGSEHFRALR